MSELSDQIKKYDDFQETSIGKLPKNWELVTLKEIVWDTDSFIPMKRPNWKFKYIDISCISRKRLSIESYSEQISERAPSRARKLINSGDIIFSTVRPYLKQVAKVIPDFDGHVCSTAFCVIRPNSKISDGDFIFHWVTRDEFITEVTYYQTGSNYPAVTDAIVLSQYIPLPPLSEQRRIAAILSCVDDAIILTDEIIGKTEYLKNGLMQDLLNNGIGHREFKSTPLGQIPKTWNVVELKEIAIIIMGTSPPGDSYNNDGLGEPLLNGPAEFRSIYPITIQWTTKPLKKTNLGDILFCVRGSTTGRMNLADKEYCIGRGIAAIRGKQQLGDTTFIRYYLELIREYLFTLAIGSGSTFPNLSSDLISKIYIKCPPLPEQQKIAAILSSVDDRLTVEREYRSKLVELKKGLMQVLLTGLVRVKTDTAEVAEGG